LTLRWLTISPTFETAFSDELGYVAGILRYFRARLGKHSMSEWMQSNRLQLNADKTDVMQCASPRRLLSLPSAPVIIAGSNVLPVGLHCPQECWLTPILMQLHMFGAGVASRCFTALSQLRQFRRYVSDECFRSLVVALVNSRLHGLRQLRPGSVDSIPSALPAVGRQRRRPLDILSWSVRTTTLPTLWPHSTGCGSPSASTTSWPFSHIASFMARLQTT
jgi:hypothetical protein